VGDFIMAIPAFKAIRDHYPQSHISLLLRRPLDELIEGAPWFDDLITCPSSRDRPSWGQYLRLIYTLYRRAFEMAIIFPNSFSSACLLWLARIPRRVGYARDGRSLLLTDRIRPPRERGQFLPQPMIEYYGGLLHHLRIPYSGRGLRLYVSERHKEEALELLQKEGLLTDQPLVGINPSAGYGPSKYWRSDYFAQVADALIEQYGCQILLLPGPGEYHLGWEIKAQMNRPAIILRGEEVNLGLLKALIDQCHLFITTDSGPRHIAVALDKPVVVIMGPTHPAYSEVGHKKTLILREELDCSPCHLKVCPTDHACMESITPQKVLRAAVTLWEGA